MRFHIVFVIFLSCLLIFLLRVSYPYKKEIKKETALDQMNVIVEKDRARAKLRHVRDEDTPERAKQMAIVDACLEKFDACSANCGTDSCEDGCLKVLSSCEKDLPLELQTLKQ